MIILLAADEFDFRRSFAHVPTGERVLHVRESADIRAEVVEPGARVVRTDRWQHDERIVMALQRLATRVQLVDPTGLLGPVLPSPGARTRDPFGSPPVGTVLTGTKQRHPHQHRNLGTQL